MMLRSSDPLGIFNVEQEFPNQVTSLSILKQSNSHRSNPSISDLAGGESQRRRTYEVTTNAAGVREYMPGDSLNRIHWPTTVRMNRLMTKEFDLDPTADIWIYLDLHRMGGSGDPMDADTTRDRSICTGKTVRVHAHNISCRLSRRNMA